MNDREVADYLLATPEFFAQHAELLATIRLANPYGKAAISLQERQMDMLRDKNKHLERRLAELLRYGHENDGLTVKFNSWTARVIAERDPYALPRVIADGLADVFDVPQTALRLWDVADTYAQAEFARHVGEEVRLFANGLIAPYCGANAGFEAAQWLAPAAAASVASAADGTAGRPADGPAASVALLALRAPQAAADAPAFGMLVLGSPDPRRFHDGMATDFLTQIGSLASAALTRLLPH
ncbi:DUF484 family protein [Burkholderia sp. lig30]|jgi:uncharacterized protein YigA (DUF484 family)|uniref:DUF484 family protein n=1 Tax=Burkholderia sp. lig30 TaxID=1192124 RepID=UPI00057263EB|nr:DUF484 family protein [Burkholderia sp. lig30]